MESFSFVTLDLLRGIELIRVSRVLWKEVFQDFISLRVASKIQRKDNLVLFLTYSCPLLRNVWEKDSFRASIQNHVYRNNVATHDRIFEIRKKAFHFSIISKNDV